MRYGRSPSYVIKGQRLGAGLSNYELKSAHHAHSLRFEEPTLSAKLEVHGSCVDKTNIASTAMATELEAQRRAIETRDERV